MAEERDPTIEELSGTAPLPYDRAKALASHEDLEVRRRLAQRNDLRPEILYYLAEDPSPEVRRAIATNEAAPRQADLLLATDQDATVRTDLAGKIATLAPGLSAHEQDRMRRTTYEALELLARDQLTRVRQILADTLKDVAYAPPEVIRRLARDAELVVSGPVLENSPVLTDADLLEIIVSDPVSGVLSAISRRFTVSEPVAEAVVAADDVEAIATLLANPSAQIREETLDRIVDRAHMIEAWHAPLVRRPKLPEGAAAKLAQFVADNLLELLTERKDLDLETAALVKAEVSRRLEEGHAGQPRRVKRKHQLPEPEVIVADDTGRPMRIGWFGKAAKEDRKMSVKELIEALKTGRRAKVIQGLASRTDVPVEVVEKLFTAQSTKGIVAVAWKAGLSVGDAVELQRKLARIPPEQVMESIDGKRFPLSTDDMNWQLSFFTDLYKGKV